MEMISVSTAMSLTGWSESTFRRRISGGSLSCIREAEGNGRSMVAFEAIKPHIFISLQEDDDDLIRHADKGSPEAQTDLALLFLSEKKFKNAIYWLRLSEKQDYASAMYYLGRCYLEGSGVPQDRNLSLMWFAKAAAYGHVIAQGRINAMHSLAVPVQTN